MTRLATLDPHFDSTYTSSDRPQLPDRKGDHTGNVLWRPALAELLATFLFVFVGAGSVVATGHLTTDLGAAGLLVIAIAHGAAIALLISAIAHLSGGHINPAVTLAAMLTNRVSIANGVSYVIAQLIGGTLGALAVGILLGSGLGKGAGTLGTQALGGMSVLQAMGIEIVLTALLVLVVFGAAMDRRGARAAAPLAIGLAIAAGYMVGVPTAGASMNPARALGPALIANDWTNIWAYIAGPLVGAAIAGLTYHHAFRAQAD